MADDTDSWAAAYDRQKSDAEWGAAYDAQTGGPQHSSTAAGMAHSALRGATFHASDHFMSEETKAKNKRFGKEHPIASTVGEGAGFVGSMFVPGVGWASKLPGLRAALPFANFEKATAAGAKAKTVLHESGKGALKTGALTRFNDDPEKVEKTGDVPTDLMRNVAARGQSAADLGKIATDYAIGAPAGWAGNKIGGLVGRNVAAVKQRGLEGKTIEGNARHNIIQDLKNDSPTGSVDDLAREMKNLMFGEGRALGRSGGGMTRESERDLATLFVRLTNKGMSDSQAAAVVAHQLQRRAAAVQQRQAGGAVGPHPDEALLNRQTGRPYAPATYGNWGRAAGENYRNLNAVPSKLPELAGLAAGGEAPSLMTTLTKLLNLKGAGQNRSKMLRSLRDRQGRVGEQTEGVLSRYANTDIRQSIEQHVRNAENANALYPQIFQELEAAGPAGAQRLRDALRGPIEGVQKTVGHEVDDISRAQLTHAEKFLNPREVVGQGSMTPLTKTVNAGVDEAGVHVQRVEPMKRITAYGDEVTHKFTPGGKVTEWEPSGDLQSILRRRAALGDAIGEAPRGSTLRRELTALKSQIDDSLRGLGNERGDPFEKAMARWATANDTRAMAGNLERAYERGLGLNMQPGRGQPLVELERFHADFRNATPDVQDVMRQGVLQQIVAKLKNKGDLHDTSKFFTNRRTREILTDVIGPEAVDELGGQMARAGMATHTFNRNKNSVTPSVLDSKESTGWLAGVANALYHGNPVSALKNTWGAAQDYRQRQVHDSMTGILNVDTSQPWKMQQTISELRRAATPISARLRRLEEEGRRIGGASGIYVGGRQSGQP